MVWQWVWRFFEPMFIEVQQILLLLNLAGTFGACLLPRARQRVVF